MRRGSFGQVVGWYNGTCRLGRSDYQVPKEETVEKPIDFHRKLCMQLNDAECKKRYDDNMKDLRNSIASFTKKVEEAKNKVLAIQKQIESKNYTPRTYNRLVREYFSEYETYEALKIVLDGRKESLQENIKEWGKIWAMSSEERLDYINKEAGPEFYDGSLYEWIDGKLVKVN